MSAVVEAPLTSPASPTWLQRLSALDRAQRMRLGAGVIVVGVLVGGRTLERTGPDLLERIKAFPTT